MHLASSCIRSYAVATIPSSAAMRCSARHAGETRIIDTSPPRVERNVDRRRPLRLAREFNHLACRTPTKPPQPRLSVSEHVWREITTKKGPQHAVIVILVAESRRLLKKLLMQTSYQEGVQTLKHLRCARWR